MDARKITGVILTALTIYAAALMLTAQSELLRAKEQTETLRRELAEQVRENEKLTRGIAGLRDEDRLESMARERLGLVYPDEIIFVDKGRRNDGSA